ncbi:hypothetical protein DFH06DRAFT_1205853 [Mycena polygramma]|nr:hypothetical protein DFH06DRAFT_1205853 [Mycena polygramma]
MDGMGDSQPTSNQLALVRSDIWFDDGTVVLQAENALFRVYRGVLAAQSPIFRDTFSIPQPATQDTYEGCPLVVLHDSATDLRLFLLATHDAGYLTKNPVDGITTLASLLRLSTKYDVDHIRSRMVSILRSIYPSHLLGYRMRRWPAAYQEKDSDDFVALRLAEEFDVPSVLPVIYYECCRYTTSDLLQADISFADKSKCILARDTFSEEWSRRIYSFLCNDPGPTCMDVPSCSRARFRRLGASELTFGPVFTETCTSIAAWGLCAICLVDAKKSFEAQRSALWHALPSLFGLAPWDDLLSDD